MSTTSELARIADGPDDAIDLLAAALAIARDEYPDLDDRACRDALDAIVRAAESGGGADPESRLSALDAVLFTTWGFRGNEADYYDPRNSYVNDVLERRLGIPISLSVLYLHAGERLGLVLEPVSFPTHFLVRSATPGAEAVIDVFRGGQRLEGADLVAMLAPLVGNAAAAREHLPRALSPVPRREVVARMLRNLKGIYVQREDWERALRVTDRLLGVAPEAFVEHRDRGHLYARVGAAHAAVADYTRYLQEAPDAPDADTVRALIVELAGSAGRLN